MKKLSIILVLACGFVISQAQPIRVTQSDVLANTDTATLNFYSIGSNLKSIQLTVVKISGTVAGKVYIKYTNDGVGWSLLDSLTLSDVATPQIKFNIPAHTSYNSYQVSAITSGTQSYTLYATAVRRPDEAY